MSGTYNFLVEPFIELGWERRINLFRKPWRIGRRLIILHPASRYKNHETEIPIRIDPRRAFGTGRHATTKGCLVALERSIKPGLTLLDLGTGTGILAIAAKKLGASKVVAVDTDYTSCLTAAENIRINCSDGGIYAVCGSIDTVYTVFDVIVANIRSYVLIGLLSNLSSLLSHNGTLILSGIMESEGAEFVKHLKAHGFIIEGTNSEEGWLTFICKNGCTSPFSLSSSD